MRRIFTLVLGLFFISLFAPLFGNAQIIPGISDPITLSIVPNIPRPNSNFTASLQSFSVDLNSSLITWFIDKKEIQKGVGLKSLSLRAGSVGSMSTISVSVSTVQSAVFTTNIIIRPADVALMWESDTYTPPFYKGKALHSYNGSFKVIALPEFIDMSGKIIDPKELIYSWSKNGNVVADSSGYGKSTFISSQTSYLREGEDITVEVSAPRDNIVAQRNITIKPTVPKIIFYENSPLHGVVYEKSLSGSFGLKNEEISIIAEPFFFSIPSRNSSNLETTWKLNGSTVYNSQNKTDITLRKVGDTGASNLGITIQNKAKLLQGANNNVVIQYGTI